MTIIIIIIIIITDMRLSLSDFSHPYQSQCGYYNH
jgi:hypothetical protein